MPPPQSPRDQALKEAAKVADRIAADRRKVLDNEAPRPRINNGVGGERRMHSWYIQHSWRVGGEAVARRIAHEIRELSKKEDGYGG
jgi:hypothetical protein